MIVFNLTLTFRNQCGLVKNLALISHVTTAEDDRPIYRLLINLGVEETAMLSGPELYCQNYLVFLNGAVVGATGRPAKLVKTVQPINKYRDTDYKVRCLYKESFCKVSIFFQITIIARSH